MKEEISINTLKFKTMLHYLHNYDLQKVISGEINFIITLDETIYNRGEHIELIGNLRTPSGFKFVHIEAVITDKKLEFAHDDILKDIWVIYFKKTTQPIEYETDNEHKITYTKKVISDRKSRLLRTLTESNLQDLR
jgi:hypothetical protein